MRPLVAIYSCEKDRKNGRNQAIRDTWGKDAYFLTDVRFFIGGSAPIENRLSDEVWVNAYDGGDDLVHKEAAMMRWAVDQGYERIFKTETDAYLVIKNILKEDTGQDWIGGFHEGGPGVEFRSSGFYDFAQGHAVWYSRKTAEIIANELVPKAEAGPNEQNRLGIGFNTTLRSGDVWVAQVLTPHVKSGNITVRDDRRFGGWPLSWHCPNRPGRDKQWDMTRVPEFMWERHEEAKAIHD